MTVGSFEQRAAMRIIFSSNYWARKSPEPELEREAEAAGEAGFDCLLFGFDDYKAGNIERAFQFAPVRDPMPTIYRGWMFRGEAYTDFYQEMTKRGHLLVTSPEHYEEAHYFPMAYDKIKDFASATVWMEGANLEQAWRASRPLAKSGMVLKDYVKSAKHKWNTACYVPPNATRTQFDSVCQAFLKDRDDAFERGLVFRQYIPLVQLEDDAEAEEIRGAVDEYRLFFWRGQLLAHAPYWRKGGAAVNFEQFEQIGPRFKSPFFTVDVARTKAGNWLVVDVGDGSVSSMPPLLPPLEFYKKLKQALD